MEAIISEGLQKEYPTSEAQQNRLTELINNFVTLPESEIRIITGDILCLAQLLYEGGQEEIIFDLRDQLNTLQRQYRRSREDLAKIEDLQKCLANFKPAIFRSIQTYFSGVYNITSELITCLPKLAGQQVGAKVEIKKTADDPNPIIFYVKAHQEFSSRSHSQFIAITSDGTGKVNFKELFIYKVLEYIGYGPQTHFIIDTDISHSRVEEGILIATQDLSYTEISEETRTFRTFREIREELSAIPIAEIDEITKRDIIAIDMLSRAFLLEDVMINQGNFGRIESQTRDGSSSIRWNVLDFISPVVRRESDDYSYGRHYPGGVNIFHSFRIGNASHNYDRDELEIITNILVQENENAQNLWLPAIDRLSHGDGQHMSVYEALNRAFEDIRDFMNRNAEILQAKQDRMGRRMADLERYLGSIRQNFQELEQGAREFQSKEISENNQMQISLTNTSAIFFSNAQENMVRDHSQEEADDSKTSETTSLLGGASILLG